MLDLLCMYLRRGRNVPPLEVEITGTKQSILHVRFLSLITRQVALVSLSGKLLRFLSFGYLGALSKLIGSAAAFCISADVGLNKAMSIQRCALIFFLWSQMVAFPVDCHSTHPVPDYTEVWVLVSKESLKTI